MNPPPFLVSFPTIQHFLNAVPEDASELYSDDFQRLCASSLPPVVSIRYLATLFGFSVRFTRALYFRSEKYYRIFLIPKGKNSRTIQAPKVALKVIQKWFGFHLSEAIKFDDCVYGFIKKRSAIDAASLHCGNNWVYSADITNFFPSTPHHLVKSALIKIGYTPHGADLIAKLCCYNGGLAQGSPASPVLSNLVFREVDTELMSVAARYGLVFTRYADDLVFSGKGEFPEELKKIVQTAVESRGWKLSPTKELLSKRPNRLKVHGLLVNGDKPRLTKGYRNKIRAFKYLMAQNAIIPEDIERIKGHLSYAHSVDKKYFENVALESEEEVFRDVLKSELIIDE